MKIRLSGLPEEMDATIDALKTVLNVVEVSTPYASRPRRGTSESKLVRVYVETTGALPAAAIPTDPV